MAGRAGGVVSGGVLKLRSFAVPVGCAAVVAMVAAAGAWGSVSGRATEAVAACATPSADTTSDGAPSSRLLRILGVLRRPRTAADALPPPLNPGGGARLFGDEGVYVKYIRLVRGLSGTSYYLVPVAGTSNLLPPCHGPEGVVLFAVEPGGFESGGGAATASQIEHGKLTSSRWLPGGKGVEYGVVPDGVRKVTIRYPAKHGLRSVTATVVNNFYVAAVPVLGLGGLPGPTPKTVVWRSAKGSVLKTFHPK
jgi:hypothetical protein